MLAVDITAFGDPDRDDQVRQYVRGKMYELLEDSLRNSGTEFHACYHEDRGDGAIVVLPSGTELGAALEPLIAGLRAGLSRHNRMSSTAAQMRLRVSLHIGGVHHDGRGLVGTDVNHLFRMLDAEPVKQAMTAPGTPLALIVSDRVYDTVVRGGAGTTVPEDFAPVQVRLKETDAPAWLRIPGRSPAPGAAPPGPAPLRPIVVVPPDIPAFTGRTVLLEGLDALAADTSAAPAWGRVAVLTGMPGAGKTGVAVHWAHQSAAHFPDARIFVDMRGYAPNNAMRADDALVQILRALGDEAPSIPATVAEREHLWHTWTATRRVLLVLDDVTDSGQVRPLLPHGAGCLTVVTTRSTLEVLAGFDGAVSYDVDVLPDDDAARLVRAIIGARRADAEPDAVRALVSRCGALPLALRIAAAKIAVRPRRSVAESTRELGGYRRLDALATADTPGPAVAAVFDASYGGLGPDVRRALRMIGLVPGVSFTAATMAHLLDVPEDTAAGLLADLEREHLIEPIGGAHYRVHDLLRDYCQARLRAEESDDDRDQAFRVLLYFYLAAALRYRRQLGGAHPWMGADDDPGRPAPGDRRTTLAWFAAEWRNLVAAVHAAHAAELWDTTSELSDALFDVLNLSRHIHENIELQRLAVHAAEVAGRPRLEALGHQRLALSLREIGRFSAALDHADLARGIAEEVGDAHLTGETYRIRGSIHWRMGRHDSASDDAAHALGHARDAGDERLEASALNLLAQIKRRHGFPESAYEDARAALEIWQRLGDRENEAGALDNIARVLRRTPGREADALDAQRQALAIFREYGDRRGEADALDGTARILRRQHKFAEAVAHAEQAQRTRHVIGDLRGEAESLDTLAHVHRSIAASGGDAQHYLWARGYGETGIRLARRIDDKYGLAEMLSNQARVLLALGQVGAARSAADESVRLGAGFDDPFGQAERLENSALVLRALNEPELADHQARNARRIRGRLAHPRDEAS
jgi:tetratricopeptide (TPR) repeat protein